VVVASLPPAEPRSLPLPDKPSIAVLPFQNLSSDPEQEYFADGMVEDLTTALSRIGGLFVIARNSSFVYKGKSPDVRQVSRELGVRYVLEGSVRRAGGRVRITCQLVNGSTGVHIWADRFDNALDDIFDLQDRVTESVAGAIEPTLRYAEIERAANKPTESLDAYDIYLRALYHHYQFTRADFEEALRLLQRAMALDPGFALAKALAASSVHQIWELGGYPISGAEKSEAIDLARSALASARDDPTTLIYAGLTVAAMGLDIEAGRIALDRAMLLNPNSAHALFVSGWLRNFAGDYSAARDELVRAMRLSPLDPFMRFLLLGQGIAMMELGEAEQAVSIIRRSIAAGAGRVWFGWSHLINCLVLLGRMDEAREAARALLELDPRRTLATARAQMGEWNSPHCERRLASLRAAGIPEA
jgi:adenylate cyclase